MQPNLAFSSQLNRYVDLLDDVALLHIAILQHNLCERDVEEATRRRHKRRLKRYQTRPWLEERSRLYGHYSRLIEELRVEDLQSFFNYLMMEPAMFDELVQRVWTFRQHLKWFAVSILPRMRPE